MSELERRIAGSKYGVELMSLISEEHLVDQIYMQGLVDRIERLAFLLKPSKTTAKLIPIARLGGMPIQFGQYANKTLDEIPLDYLDWLCNSSEVTAKTIKEYLNHPELEARRRGLGD